MKPEGRRDIVNRPDGDSRADANERDREKKPVMARPGFHSEEKLERIREKRGQ
jgi:hypothetical protein